MDIVGEQSIVSTCRKLGLFVSQSPVFLAAGSTSRHTAWLTLTEQACDGKCKAVLGSLDFGCQK
jgi:hypothetical protein